MPDAPNFEHQIDVECWAGPDERIAELAQAQHGVVARWQLLGIGLGRGAIARRVEAKRLHVIHRGVYAVGHRLISQRGWWMAAVLAGGPDAVLSYRSAAVLWGLLEADRGAVDISVRSGAAG